SGRMPGWPPWGWACPGSPSRSHRSRAFRSLSQSGSAGASASWSAWEREPSHRTGEMKKPALEIQTVLSRLSDTPGQIALIVRGRREQQLHRKPEEDSWSAREIVAHLRACAEVWGRSIQRMANEDHPTIRYVSPRGWIKKTDYLQQTFADNLRAL